MFHRGFALLAVLAVTPARAALIEYSFTAELDPSRSSSTLYDEFGLVPFSRSFITGGFLFDDAAPMTSHRDYQINGASGSSSTYDMSNLRLWVDVGDYVLAATGSALGIFDDPNSVSCRCGPNVKDEWILSTRGDGDDVNGHTVTSITLDLLQFTGNPLTSSELQVADAAHWNNYIDNRSFRLLFTDGYGFAGWLTSIAPTTTSVPEPATLSLLAVGAFGALATRRRRQVAANA